MKFGCCTSLDNIGIVEKAGYDYVELPVNSVKPEAEEKQFLEVRKQVEQFELKPEVFNCFIPAHLKIVGPSTDSTRIYNYVRMALERMAILGAKIVVFGSGGARKIPEGFSREKALRQLEDFLEMTSGEAQRNSLLIAIEPLRKEETNVIHQVNEAYELSLKVNQKSVRVLADFYHMNEENEPLSNLIKVKDGLIHIHVADTGRKYPGSGGYDYSSFFKFLKKARYDARISCECKWNNFTQEAGKALSFLRNKCKGGQGKADIKRE